MSEAQVGTIHDLLAECIACAGVFDVSTDYEADKADLENATQAVLDHVQALRDERDRLREALMTARVDVAQKALDIVKSDNANGEHQAVIYSLQALVHSYQAALTPAGQRLTPNEATE